MMFSLGLDQIVDAHVVMNVEHDRPCEGLARPWTFSLGLDQVVDARLVMNVEHDRAREDLARP